MTRPVAIAGSILFFFLAPGVIGGLIPWWISRWDASYSNTALLVVGGLMTTLALAALVACFARFALEGLGTPAPVAPTKTLVVSGLYRFVRNPMYVAVSAIILGQALMFASATLIAYGIVIWFAFQAFILMYEEPTLKGAFPDQYAAYFAAVPRWIPRLKPWAP